jgi:Domain of unknown function (DUF305)
LDLSSREIVILTELQRAAGGSMIAICRNLTGCLIAACLGAVVPMSSAQERPTMPAMQPHVHPGSAAPLAPSSETETQFLAANEPAMSKMMADMAVAPTGDIDRDFVAMMVPHHQGAIDMAQVILRYGKNEQLKRLAQEIIVTQQQEIAAMRLAVGDPLPPSIPSPTQPASGAIPPDASSGAMHMHPSR